MVYEAANRDTQGSKAHAVCTKSKLEIRAAAASAACSFDHLLQLAQTAALNMHCRSRLNGKQSTTATSQAQCALYNKLAAQCPLLYRTTSGAGQVNVQCLCCLRSTTSAVQQHIPAAPYPIRCKKGTDNSLAQVEHSFCTVL
jgi:hypothetical protein